VVPELKLQPDTAAIRRDLVHMTRRWPELGVPVMFELRAFAEHRTPQIGKFALDWLDDAVDWAAQMNAIGCNIYAVRNPIRADFTGSAKDTDIVAAFALWADCDDGEAAANVRNFVGPKWTSSVITGTVPSTRVHTYWELAEPITDMAAWRATQAAIAATFQSDPAVINPSRIMRVGGTVSHPFEQKRQRGYISEICTIRTEYDDARAPVPFETMQRLFAGAAPAPRPVATGFTIDTGADYAPPLDRETARIKALSGDAWNIEVFRLVGSYVRKGMTDAEIRTLTDPLTLAGYTVDQTRAEVASMIRRTRDNPKFQDSDQARPFVPNFDHAPAPSPSFDAPPPAAPLWKMQSAAEFTADFVAPEYIVDGVIQRGRLYTMTAPTGSGKTAVMLYAATSVAGGTLFYDRDVEQGDVLFMAGENPDDVRARMIGTMEYHKIDPAKCRVHFIAGTFSIRADFDRIAAEAAKLPNLVLIVIDTFAAYFDGDDENSNAQALDFARVARKLTALPAKPAVVMPAHPVKNAAKGNLSPKGGSSLVNEVDGNLTLWNEGGVITMHWQVKFRGPDFEPLVFELQRHESALICDAAGRIMPTILAKPMLLTRAMQMAQESLSVEDRLLLNIQDAPALSLAERAAACGLSHKQKVARILEKLAGQKLIRKFRTNWELTKDGERAVEIITSGGKFAPEI
jgi:hypothetical protein